LLVPRRFASIPRMSTERPGAARWRDSAASYLETFDGPYHAHRMAMVWSLLDGVPLDGARCFDFGCGHGGFLAQLAARGAVASGCDVNPTMVDAARAAGFIVELGGVERMAAIAHGSLDLIASLNVLAYLEPDEEAAFYRQAHRALRPGGLLLVTHSNELFDLFTLNSFTLAFMRRHFGAAVAAL
jgi:SAM-dependent methyltransferase